MNASPHSCFIASLMKRFTIVQESAKVGKSVASGKDGTCEKRYSCGLELGPGFIYLPNKDLCKVFPFFLSFETGFSVQVWAFSSLLSNPIR